MIRIKQFLCGILGHKFKTCDPKREYDRATKLYTITDVCCHCGKRFSFKTLMKNFEIKQMDI